MWHEGSFPQINLIRKYIWCFQKCTFLSSGLLMTAVYIYWRHSLRWGRTHKLAFFMLSLLVFWRQWIHNGPLPSLQSQIHLLHKPRHCLRIISLLGEKLTVMKNWSSISPLGEFQAFTSNADNHMPNAKDRTLFLLLQMGYSMVQEAISATHRLTV